MTTILGIVLALIVLLLVIQKKRNATDDIAPSQTPVETFDPGPIIADDLSLDWDIRYIDRDGVVTDRRITVNSLHGSKHPRWATAFCHLRRDIRHFNLYNVDTAVDVDTGENIPVTYHLLDWIADQERRKRDDISDKGITLEIVTNDAYNRPSERWAIDVTSAIIQPNGLCAIRGKGRREKTTSMRKWTGTKSFYADMCKSITDKASGEVFDNLDDFVTRVRR